MVPAAPVLATGAYPKYSSPEPAGASAGKVTVVEERLAIPPSVSTPHTVPAPGPENSWAASSTLMPVTVAEKATVTVADPVLVTVPAQISWSSSL